MKLYEIILAYLLMINIFTMYTFFLDKSKAKNKKWRIKESTLFLLSIIGGSLGAILGMKLFRHKTKHWYFKYGIPFILAVQVILTVYTAVRFRDL
ncbi:DUF1294 domain-containing protein [Sebaldella sp. S0638]|uniref:DUF1294 domain-containing protein n=1 Tax=Sebaldella sp. S0638 TaxID=2957809 RepID=UPI0020A2105B|nr:DUF1294 domain-containing protein [Sebaldella sp. S0638]MCP1224039.1 DUF1294 domain-containing protein [Sebaldella sp. S0638]